MINEIEISKPKYLLYVNIGKSWIFWPNFEKHIINWVNEYTAKNYKLTAICDVFPDRFSSIKKIGPPTNYTPQSKDFIYIFERLQ
jgi:hypothetical protein